jgi:hypothetical protein
MYAGLTSNYTFDPLYELTQVTQATNITESYSLFQRSARNSPIRSPVRTNNLATDLDGSGRARSNCLSRWDVRIDRPDLCSRPGRGVLRTGLSEM